MSVRNQQCGQLLNSLAAHVSDLRPLKAVGDCRETQPDGWAYYLPGLRTYKLAWLILACHMC